MRRPSIHHARTTALVAHAVGYTLAIVVAAVNAPHIAELAHDPQEALARGLVPEGLFAYGARAGRALFFGAAALFVVSSVFGSVSRLATTRAAVYGDRPAAAFAYALGVVLHTLLARLVVLVGGAVLVGVVSIPLVVLAAAWRHPHDARLHDLTLLGLATLPLAALFVVHVIDELVHAAIVVHGPRPLEAVVLAARPMRGVATAAVSAALFGLGVRVLVARIALAASSGVAVTLLSFGSLALVALLRAQLFMSFAAALQRHDG